MCLPLPLFISVSIFINQPKLIVETEGGYEEIYLIPSINNCPPSTYFLICHFSPEISFKGFPPPPPAWYSSLSLNP